MSTHSPRFLADAGVAEAKRVASGGAAGAAKPFNYAILGICALEMILMSRVY